MLDNIRELYEFVKNPDQRWTEKVSAGGAIVVILIFLELLTGLGSGFINSQRIEQVIKIETALQSRTLDTSTVKYLTQARTELIGRGIFPSFSWGAIGGVVYTYVTTPDHKPKNFTLFGKPMELADYTYLNLVSVAGLWFILIAMSARPFFRRPSWATFKTGLFLYVTMLASMKLILTIPINTVESRLIWNVVLQILSIAVFAWVATTERPKRSRKNEQILDHSEPQKN